MKNKPLLIALIFAALYIAVTLYFYHTERFEMFRMVYVMSMASMLPLCVLVIKIQRDTVYKGFISGREAAKEGVRFSLYVAIILICFQVVFYYGGFRDFKADYIPGSYRALYEKKNLADKIEFIGTEKKITHLKTEEIKKIESDFLAANKELVADYNKKSLTEKVEVIEAATKKKMLGFNSEQIKKFEGDIIKKDIEADINNITLFKEVSAVFFRIIFGGLFSSFLAALFLKRRQ